MTDLKALARVEGAILVLRDESSQDVSVSSRSRFHPEILDPTINWRNCAGLNGLKITSLFSDASISMDITVVERRAISTSF